MIVIDSSVIMRIGAFLRQAYEIRSVHHQSEVQSLLVTDGCLSGRYRALEAASLLTLQAFCDRDMYTHACRIASLAQMAGRILQLSAQELATLYLASLLHDIGKPGIPAVILQKPGMLDLQERACMQMHAQLGQCVLQIAGEDFVSLAAIVVAHHEFWNGGGYPYGLRGSEIPLLARIIAVVDAFDAMISQRNYRQPKTMRQAFQELQRCAEQQFDPDVVHAFLSLFGLPPYIDAYLNGCNYDGFISSIYVPVVIAPFSYVKSLSI